MGPKWAGALRDFFLGATGRLQLVEAGASAGGVAAGDAYKQAGAGLVLAGVVEVGWERREVI